MSFNRGLDSANKGCENANTIFTCIKNPIYVFLFWESLGISPNFRIYVSVSDLYIPRISWHISCSRIGRLIVGIYCINRSQTHECRKWEYLFRIFGIVSLQCCNCPNSYIPISVSDLYIPKIGLAYSAAGKYCRWTDHGNI